MIELPAIGIKLQIIKGLNTFDADTTKFWDINLQAARDIVFIDLFSAITKSTTTDLMLNSDSRLDDQFYKNLWLQHFSPVYKFAGLLMCYIYRLNDLWQV